MDTMKLGEKLEILRVKLNLSAKELSDKAKISRSYYSEIVNGRVKMPKADVLNRLAEVLDCDVQFLIRDSATFESDNPEIMKLYSKELREFIMSADNKPIIVFAKHTTNMDIAAMCDEERLLLVKTLENVLANTKFNSRKLL